MEEIFLVILIAIIALEEREVTSVSVLETRGV